MIVGCLPRWKDTILLCKRSIEPKNGFWTLPAGFLENDESVEEGALRETMEEANAEVEIVRLFSLYSVPTIGQVYLFFLANLKNLDFRPGAETEQTVLFPVHDIPWDAIAFPSVRFTLERYVENIATEGNEVYRGAYRPS
jgi:ADP-ribose pyrophosphatase YjhB (NUDIX family)